MKGLAVVILSGGEGRRIGGGKPARRLGNARLIDSAVEQGRSWSDTVAIAVRTRSQAPSVDAEIIEDEAIEGPLGGLAAGLAFAQGRDRPFLLTIPADMPFLPPDLLDRLGTAIPGFGCALASSGGHAHPVCGLWRSSAVSQIGEYVSTGGRSLKGFAALIGVVAVDWATDAGDPFFNINSPDDLAEAEKRLR